MKRTYMFYSVSVLVLCLPLLGAGSTKPQVGNTTDNDKPEVDKPVKNACVSFAEFETSLKNGAVFEVPLSGELELKVKSFDAGDRISFTLRNEPERSWTLSCTKADDKSGAVFPIPSDFRFIGGMCRLEISAGSKSISANTFVSVIDNTIVDKKSGYTSYGRIIDWKGTPVEGVAVSDGEKVTLTDSQGRYYLKSERVEGFVFISVPKDYRVAVNKTIPQFFQRFESSKSVYEQHNFILEPRSNSKSRVIVWSDAHLANRTNDKVQFRDYFLPDIEEQIRKAAAEEVPLYALSLGDTTWDEYWYKNSFGFPDWIKIVENLDIPVYSIPGNHDNDPNISDDFKAAAAFRDNMGPTYFSMNIGDIHYIMMDNTIFNNKGGNVQDYVHGFTDRQMKWLEADIKTVPKGSTIIFGLHIPVSNRPDAKNTFTYNMPANYRTRIFTMLDGCKVHFVSGHTHTNYTNRLSDTMIEHNIAAVCGTWWWTGYYSGNGCRINGDGSPSGYKVFDINGKVLEWKYKSLARSESYQFRAYDLANSLMTRGLYCPSSKTNVSDSFFSTYANGWDLPQNTSSTKDVLVNVFDFGPDWKIEVTENGVAKTVTHVESYDPLHTIHFNMARMNSGSNGSTSMTFPTGKSSHFFKASTSSSVSVIQIKVTDPFGRVYQETLDRPRSLYDMSKTKDKY